MTSKSFQRRILRKSPIWSGGLTTGAVNLYLECSHTKVVDGRNVSNLLGYAHCSVCECNESKIKTP